MCLAYKVQSLNHEPLVSLHRDQEYFFSQATIEKTFSDRTNYAYKNIQKNWPRGTAAADV